ncbi:hypothetical protein FOA52_010075 [Chlamydomonas sp. UWO 241]|nr:hypothetical protein FOA52_010075 [Chlamydomonas sp. UWO 241]
MEDGMEGGKPHACDTPCMCTAAPMQQLPHVPDDLMLAVASYMPSPNALLRCSRATADMARSPHALSMWLAHQHGTAGALLAFTQCPCAASWDLPRVRAVVARLLDGGAQLPPGLTVPVLHWAAVTLADGDTLQLLVSRLAADSSTPGTSARTELTGRSLGGQLLTDAAAAGSESAVRVLLAAGATPRDSAALKAASARGHAGVVAALLSSGRVDPRADSDCCLRTAAKFGHTDVLRALLDAGCSTHARQDEALCLSVGGGHTDAVRLLLSAGADASARPALLQLAVCSPAGGSSVAEWYGGGGRVGGGAHGEASHLGGGGSGGGGAQGNGSGGAHSSSGAHGGSSCGGAHGSSGSSSSGSGPHGSGGSSGVHGGGRRGDSRWCEPSSASPHGGHTQVLVRTLVDAGARDDGGLALCAAAASGRRCVVSLLLSHFGSVYGAPPAAADAASAGAAAGPAAAAPVAGPAAAAPAAPGAAAGAAAGPAPGAAAGPVPAAAAAPAGGGGAGSSHNPPRDPRTAALQHALVNGHMEIADELLGAGAPIDSTVLQARHHFYSPPDALSLLHAHTPATLAPSCDLDEELSQAASDLDPATVRLLLRWGANPTSHECQALRKAVLHGRTESVRTLLAAAGAAGLKYTMPCCVMRAAVQRGHLEITESLLAANLWPSPSARHCCVEPRTCAARVLCASSCLAMTSLLMRFGAAQHAADALRLVACGKAPSWRNEEVVAVVMEAMVGCRLLSQLTTASNSSSAAAAAAPAAAGTGAAAPAAAGTGAAVAGCKAGAPTGLARVSGGSSCGTRCPASPHDDCCHEELDGPWTAAAAAAASAAAAHGGSGCAVLLVSAVGCTSAACVAAAAGGSGSPSPLVSPRVLQAAAGGVPEDTHGPTAAAVPLLTAKLDALMTTAPPPGAVGGKAHLRRSPSMPTL